MLVIFGSSTGLSCPSALLSLVTTSTFAIASTTSSPSITSPNPAYNPFILSLSAFIIKNCESAEL